MMDCSTTGIEPDIALVKYKSLAGGGLLKIVNQTVPMALKTLGYDTYVAREVMEYIEQHDTIEGAPGLKPEHLPVFDCAFPPAGGGRSISWRGHLKMMAAAQPFLSGAISKTINMSNDSTIEDIRAAYLEGWRLGLKAVAVYRDGSKGSQPLSTSAPAAVGFAPEEMERRKRALSVVMSAAAARAGVSPDPAWAAEVFPTDWLEQLAARATAAAAPTPARQRLPVTRRSMTHKFDIQGHEGYVTVGFFDDGRPGELFVTMAKEGSTVGGLMDVIGTVVSLGLQYGVPLEVFVNKFAHGRFEPSGFTRNPDIPIAKSITDYIFRWLGMEFLPGYREANAPARLPETVELPKRRTPPPAPEPIETQRMQFARFQSDAPACDQCGAVTVRAGACYRCYNCGHSMGCS